MLDVQQLDDAPALNLFMTAFRNDGSGRPLWVVASGPISDSHAEMSAIAGTGGNFIGSQPAAPVTVESAGWVHVRRADCDRLEMRYDVIGLGLGEAVLRPFAQTLVGDQSSCGRHD